MVGNFLAGILKDHVGSWKSPTTDPVILDIISTIILSLGIIPPLKANPLYSF